MLKHSHASPTPPARTVVVGARGFVGRRVTRTLEQCGWPVLALGSDSLDLLADDAAARLAEQLRPDDAMVFVSALTPDRGRDIATFMKNLTMAEAACRALAAQPIRHLVYIGSDAVYPDAESRIVETTPCHPGGFHGMMHLARELMFQTAMGPATALLRPSLLYGADDTHNGYGPNRFRRQVEKGETITLFGGGEECRDHVLVDDLATIVRLCLEHGSQGVLNVATGRSLSFHYVAELAIAASGGQPVEIRPTPRNNPIIHRHFDIISAIKAFPGFAWTAPEEGFVTVWRELEGRRAAGGEV
ncbi:NAD-dependent epimerase/dehydratase family protein [Azospirillum cavernae]|uniref:NAD-dependent epimerase/dehydratase family protein n=1 Tax=Azospirillum cavernae TaxID=2320860 RepID=A0A418VL30_9PROT|nr:NAD-dependent epimerase/dehydratase family protein [Azospirillum cavernae]RJF76868.1 NAD-dependent epimerase/dehydratase family protein [Azospirillum cavernae]